MEDCIVSMVMRNSDIREEWKYDENLRCKGGEI